MGLPPCDDALSNDDLLDAVKGAGENPSALGSEQVVMDLLALVSRHVQNLRKEIARELEAKVTKLQAEKKQLHAKLEAAAMTIASGTMSHPLDDGNSSRPSVDAWPPETKVREAEQLTKVRTSDGTTDGLEGKLQTAKKKLSSLSSSLSAMSPRAEGEDNHRAHQSDAPHRRMQHVFPDAEAMKEKVRQAIAKPNSRAFEEFHTSGVCQYMARHTLFEYGTLFIIACNSVWIAIELDNNTAPRLIDADWMFLLGENFFCLYFTFEWVVRFGAYIKKRAAFKNTWFVFDTFLVTAMILETWLGMVIEVTSVPPGDSSSGSGSANSANSAGVLKLVRMVRLTRIVRLVRLLRAVPELLVLIKGILCATRSVFFTLCLLFFVVYVFAIAFRQLTDGTAIGSEHFSNVPEAMCSLLLRVAMPDHAEMVYAISYQDIFLGVLSFAFVLLATLTMLNMLVGVLCEVVSCVSAVEKEQLLVDYAKTSLLEMLEGHEMGQDGPNPLLTQAEVASLLTNPCTARIIQQVGADPVGMVDYVSILFADKEVLRVSDFIMTVIELRGGRSTTVKDMMELRKFVAAQIRKLEQAMQTNLADEFSRQRSQGTIQLQASPPPPPGGGGGGAHPQLAHSNCQFWAMPGASSHEAPEQVVAEPSPPPPTQGTPKPPAGKRNVATRATTLAAAMSPWGGGLRRGLTRGLVGDRSASPASRSALEDVQPVLPSVCIS